MYFYTDLQDGARCIEERDISHALNYIENLYSGQVGKH